MSLSDTLSVTGNMKDDASTALKISTPGFGLFGGSDDKKPAWDTPGTAEYYRLNAPDYINALREGMSLSQYLKVKPMLDISNQYMDKINEANQANEKRYQEGLNMWDNILDQFSGTMPKYSALPEEYGMSQLLRIGQEEKRNLASTNQSLISSGLLNTTARIGAEQGVRDSASSQRMDLADSITNLKTQREDAYNSRMDAYNQNKANLQASKIGFVERKEDIGPDFNYYGSMMNLMATKPQLWKKQKTSLQAQTVKGLTNAGVDLSGLYK